MKFTSPVYSAVSGSIAGVTYSHNRGGMYTRARAVPTNPNSIRQQNVRASFNAAIQAWSSSLTDAQRAAWRTYAENVPVTNKLGQVVKLTGQQMFIRNYAFGMQPQVQAILSVPMAGPTIFNTGASVWRVEDLTTSGYPNIGIAGTAGADIDTNFKLTGEQDASATLVIFVGPAQPAGVNYYKGPYRLSGVMAVAVAGNDEFNWTAAQTTRLDGFPAWAADDRIPLRARVYYTDGRLSEAYEAILPVIDNSSP